ncbi:MAG: hypothetical protein GY758_20175 [Fuerstiella sp.]|jgi:hypothetical protein|nr:hypothetical protein [Fuerstiella sp.]
MKFWREGGCQFRENLTADDIRLHRRKPTPVVGGQKSLLSQLLQQSLGLGVLELYGLQLPLVDHAAEGGEQNAPGLEQERHVQRRIGQLPMPRDAIKRLRWETLVSRQCGVSSRFEFGEVFDPTGTT